MASIRLALARAMAAAPRAAVPRPVVRARPGLAGLRPAFSRVRLYSDDTGAGKRGEAGAEAAAEKSGEAGPETGAEKSAENSTEAGAEKSAGTGAEAVAEKSNGQKTDEAGAPTGAAKTPEVDAEADADKIKRQKIEEARAEDRAHGLAEHERNQARKLEKYAEHRRRMGLDLSNEEAAEMGIDNCAFYLINVPFNMTPNEVIQEADGLDGVVSISVIPDAVGKFQFFFKDSASMAEAFEKVHRSELRGRVVKANRYVPAMAIQAPSDSIFFMGIPEDATDAELDSVFAGLENTRRIDVLRGSGLNAMYRGYGFARFRSVAAAIEGYKVLLGKTIRGKQIRCDFAKLTGSSLQQSIKEKKKKKKRSAPLKDATPEERKRSRGYVWDESSKTQKAKEEKKKKGKGEGEVKPGKAGGVQDAQREKARQENEVPDPKKEMTRQADETQDVIEELAQEADATGGVREEADQKTSELQDLKTKMAKQAEELQAMREKMSDLESRGQQGTER